MQLNSFSFINWQKFVDCLEILPLKHALWWAGRINLINPFNSKEKRLQKSIFDWGPIHLHVLKYFNINFNVEIRVEIFQHNFQCYNLCWNITTEISTLKFVLHFQFTNKKCNIEICVEKISTWISTRISTLKFVLKYCNTCRWILNRAWEENQ